MTQTGVTADKAFWNSSENYTFHRGMGTKLDFERVVVFWTLVKMYDMLPLDSTFVIRNIH